MHVKRFIQNLRTTKIVPQLFKNFLNDSSCKVFNIAYQCHALMLWEFGEFCIETLKHM